MENDPGSDTLTSFLIAQLALDDIQSVASSRKGKARGDTALTDEEIAFRVFERENDDVVDSLNLARSLQLAIDGDQEVLQRMSIVDMSEADDRRYAEALARGEVPPEMTDAQKAIET
ncbi:hypothetical protein GYMLUDRAFT_1026397 [Collybiopsis luxurians FD-317 M1]|uniref:Unplaced genomic scaffold GYMLUscaffold_81, whole genome shotgun sequence n=1 Tax=Collybiopsis luxurians FD-317 M1 TaxID=944289 RepID=A0A0D0ASN4_9AGAR|nr:hypothetical protein GYMLUDRAFT_1026397 [Collybiopsis luxurians FD-317 M1]